MKGGGTLNPGDVSSWDGSGAAAVRGGGGGPGLAPDAARALPLSLPDGCAAGPGATANLPASASGGGALNRGFGGPSGDGVLGGVSSCSREGSRSGKGLREAGGAGAGPLLLLKSASDLDAGGPGGGGGGGARPEF